MTLQFTSAIDRFDESIARLVAFANLPAQSPTDEVPGDIISLIENHPGPVTSCAYNQLTDPQAQRRLLYAQHVAFLREMRRRHSGTRLQKAYATFKWACGLEGPPAHKSLSDAEDDRVCIRFMAVMTLVPICTLALIVASAIMKNY